MIGILLLRDKDTDAETGDPNTTSEATVSVNGGNVAPTEVSGTDNSTSETSSKTSVSSETTQTTTTTAKPAVYPNSDLNSADLLYDGNGHVNGVKLTIYGTFDKISSDATVVVNLESGTDYGDFRANGRTYRDVYCVQNDQWLFDLDNKTNDYYYTQMYYENGVNRIPELDSDSSDYIESDDMGSVNVKMEDEKCIVTVKFNPDCPINPDDVNDVSFDITENALVNSQTGAGNKDWYDSRDIT